MLRLWNRNSPNCQPTASLHFVPLSTIKWIDGLSLNVGLTVYSVCLWVFLFVCLFVLIFNAFTIVYPHSWEEHPDIKIDDSFSGERMYRCDVQMHMHKKNNACQTVCELFVRRMPNQTLVERQEPSSSSYVYK